MKNLFLTVIVLAICYLLPKQLHAQETFKASISADITFGHAPDCMGFSGICTFQTESSGKTEMTTQMQFNAENKELILVLPKASLEALNTAKLLNNELEKGYYLYAFEEDYVLPNNIKTVLNITKLTQIKKGSYLVKEINNQFIMKLKLE